MKTIPTAVYSFEELDDDAKEKAREWYREGSLDYEWWDCAVDDAKTVAALFGLDIDHVYFSGFSSQGDGACFVGHYRYKPGGLAAVKEYAPQDTELHDIVRRLQNLQRGAFYKLTAHTSHRGHYYHSGGMSVSVDHYDRAATECEEDDLTDLLSEFADWIYSRLEKEHAWLNADEQVDESIIFNGYTFTESGRRFG